MGVPLELDQLGIFMGHHLDEIRGLGQPVEPKAWPWQEGLLEDEVDYIAKLTQLLDDDYGGRVTWTTRGKRKQDVLPYLVLQCRYYLVKSCQANAIEKTKVLEDLYARLFGLFVEHYDRVWTRSEPYSNYFPVRSVGSRPPAPERTIHVAGDMTY
jgi:hypothetical protein